MARIFVLFIPLLLAFFGGVMLLSEVQGIKTAELSRRWQMVTGEIVAAEFECSTTVHSRNVSEESCFPVSRYRYEVEGKVFTGNRIEASGTQLVFDSHQEARMWAELNYPTGSLVDVYFDPEDPGSSLLNPGRDKMSSPAEGIITGLMFLLLGLGIAGGLVWFWWFRRERLCT